MPTRTISTRDKYTVAFLLHKETGRQVDLTACDVELTTIQNYVEVESWGSYGRERIDTKKEIVCNVHQLVKRGDLSISDTLETVGTEWILNVGQEENAFHLPLFLDNVMIEPLSVGRKSFDNMQLLGLGDFMSGIHDVGRYIRFDVGDGTYVQKYLTNPEVVNAQMYVERWYNKRGVWKW